MDEFDRQMDGGVPVGSVVAITAPPEAQTGPILRSFMAERPTVYITTLRSEAAVQDQMNDCLPTAEFEVRRPGLETPIDDTMTAVQLVDGQSNVVVDSVTPLEQKGDFERYVKFLNSLDTHVENTGGVAVLYCSDTQDPTPLRDVTLEMADVVLELIVDVNGTTVENHLHVAKFRGERLLDETIKLNLGQEVQVDTSRDIA